MKEFWMCFIEGHGAPKKQHQSKEVAQGEAARLASLYPSRTVHILSVLETIEPTVAPSEEEWSKEPPLRKLSRRQIRALAAKKREQEKLAEESPEVNRSEPVIVVKKRRSYVVDAI